MTPFVPANTPCVSVIVPIYNVAGHVRACIDSLRAQTLHDFEVLMIDDGSTDGSGEIAFEAAENDPRFRLIRQENAGLSGARNTGLGLATGDFIAFVDSDDRVMPDYLMRMWQVLGDTGGDWIACAVRNVLPDGSGHTHSAIHGAADLSHHPVPRRYAFDSWSDVIRHFPSAWNKLYRRSLIEGLRYDEGTWFEDHGFFNRVAARTDHIIHLPEALYLQTRGRAGQITGQDDDRVFEQFDVLTQMRDFFAASPRAGGQKALSQIASRLIFERSTVLADPDRRARFAQASQDFLAANDLSYDPDWDPDIGLSWRAEMEGAQLLSVILSWDGEDMPALMRSLDSLRIQTAPGHEVLIVCQNDDAERTVKTSISEIPENWQILRSPQDDEGAGFNHGLTCAGGDFVGFVVTGDRLEPWTLLDRTEVMLREQADFGLTQMGLVDVETGKLSYHNGMHDMVAWPGGTPPTGAFEMSPLQVLTLEAQCTAKIFRRSFLHAKGLSFTQGPRGDWALCLTAALLSRRTVYISQAGATVRLYKHEFERWHTAYSAQDLIKGNNALLETIEHVLPDEEKAALPRGWQRRLFVRALREQVYSAAYPSRWQRYAMLLGAARHVMRCGYSVPQAAGLDAAIGPRLAQLLDPMALMASKLRLGRLRAPVLPLVQQASAKALTEIAQPLHAFHPGPHGVLQLRVDLRVQPAANMFFYAAGTSQALFHLSLRQAAGLAVCNDQRPDGRWRAERACPVDLSSGLADVTVTFTPPEVFVTLNGQEIFRFGARSLRHRAGFSNLDKIDGFTCNGEVITPSVLTGLTDDALSLDPRLNLRLHDADATSSLRVSPSGAELQVIPSFDGAASALLPGRLWRDVPAEAPLTVELTQGGEIQTLVLSRTDIAMRIEALLSLPLAPTDSSLCLHLLEHVRYGHLMHLLSPSARVWLDHIAKFYAAQSFLHAQQEGVAPVVRTLPEDPVEKEVEGALARLAQSQSGPKDQRPDPLSVVADLHVSQVARPRLFLALTSFFCVEDSDFAGLYHLAQSYDGLLPFDLLADRSNQSALLPYMLLGGQYDELAQTLHKLAKPGPEWLNTPAIGWAVRTAITDLDGPARAAIIQEFALFLRRRAPNYWDRVHCAELTRTAATLIIHRHRLTPSEARDAIALCLEVYGLSRQFWAQLEHVTDLPEDISLAQRSFAQIMDTQASRDLRLRALALFEEAGTVDAPRLRYEMFGPASGSNADLFSLTPPDQKLESGADTPQMSRSILRHMAYPTSTAVTPDAAALATAAFPSLYPETPCAPHLVTQQAVAEQAMALLGGEANVDIALLTDRLTQLAEAESGHIGMGIALSLINGLHDGDTEQAAYFCEWMQQQMDRLDPASWEAAPALRQPARQLAQREGLMLPARDLLKRMPADSVSNGSDLSKGSSLFDTIVIVFSCRAYQETRIPALRAGWLSLLTDLGVPYLVVVGDGDGTCKGDTLYLDAPDDYEGLPQKTLAAIKWVHDNTSFGHMLKIDDDCFLNAPLFFKSLSYAKFDYYGRQLHRVAGQMDRIWHQAKSSSLRGQFDLDKSAEPSEYADGGSAYTLSRTAMAAALDAAASPEGRRLIEVSFMEDKMLGDLLAIGGIHVAQEDYRVSIRRRTYGEAIPVPSWLNSFNPSTVAPLHLIHLDTHLDQAKIRAGLTEPNLTPHKIWPSYQDVTLGYQSNALELVSSVDSVTRARQAQVAVVACMRNEMFMLPSFLAHYRKLGVEAFLIADNCSDDGTLEYLAQQPDVAVFTVDTDYKSSHYGVAWQQAMMSAFRLGKWSLVADADELLVWQEKQQQSLPELLETPAFASADAARVFMLDMYPQGPLEEATFASGDPFAEAGFADSIPFLENTLSRGPYSDQACWTSALRHRLIPGSRPNLFVAQKLALLRYQPWMRLSAGLHFVGDVDIAPRELIFAHFKYNADFRRKAQAEVMRGQHFNDAEEYRKYLALASEGRSVIHDPHLSAPWAQVPFVKRRLQD
ncbi:glycosyltransferase [Sulfitobacter undariae]|nr:glycosyltransferase [Sulfitobacter undariae]